MQQLGRIIQQIAQPIAIVEGETTYACFSS